jgi:luciferase family oxidoreductase group 1
MGFQLSVLDQSPVPEDSTPGDALRNSLELAALTDSLGFHRYWVAEHHGTPGLACNSPEVLIGPIASATSRLRVGSGGIMLPHYSPLKVASSFSMLAGLYPDRIDLGVGRAAGTSPRVAQALQRDQRQPPPDDFPEQLTELLAYFEPRRDSAIRFHAPEVWMLGSSPQSAVWAAEHGLPYAFADFINSDGVAAARFYRQNFRPSQRLQRAQTAVAAWVFCADTDEEALRLSFSFRMMALQLFRGRPIPVPTIERADEFLRKEGFPPEALPVGRRILTGSPTTIRRSIEALAAGYGADEVLAVNIAYSHAARLRSYELLAEAFELAATPVFPARRGVDTAATVRAELADRAAPKNRRDP